MYRRHSSVESASHCTLRFGVVVVLVRKLELVSLFIDVVVAPAVVVVVAAAAAAVVFAIAVVFVDSV